MEEKDTHNVIPEFCFYIVSLMPGFLVSINNCIKVSSLDTVCFLYQCQLNAGKRDEIFEKSLQSSDSKLLALSHVYGVVYHIYEECYRSVTPRTEDC